MSLWSSITEYLRMSLWSSITEYFHKAEVESYKVTNQDVIYVVNKLGRKNFLTTTILEEIYRTKNVPDEYWNAHYREDLEFVQNVLNELVEKGKLEKWDVYYKKPDNDDNFDLESIVNAHGKAIV